jgi:hypothetical protein
MHSRMAHLLGKHIAIVGAVERENAYRAIFDVLDLTVFHLSDPFAVD